jgi:hypothetical protein
MYTIKVRFVWLLIVLFLSLQGISLTHATQQTRTLSVSGHPGELAVVEMAGRSYVEIEALARLSNGSLIIHGNRMVLTLSDSRGNMAPPSPPIQEPVASGFSKDFIKAGIEQMAEVREWRSTLVNAIQRGYRVTPDWVDNFSNRAQQNLRLTSLAVSTESDRAAFQLLTNVFDNMKELSDRFLKLNSSMTYIPTDSLNNDPLDQRILKCARALAAMAASNQFVDDASCH